MQISIDDKEEKATTAKIERAFEISTIVFGAHWLWQCSDLLSVWKVRATFTRFPRLLSEDVGGLSDKVEAGG